MDSHPRPNTRARSFFGVLCALALLFPLLCAATIPLAKRFLLPEAFPLLLAARDPGGLSAADSILLKPLGVHVLWKAVFPFSRGMRDGAVSGWGALCALGFSVLSGVLVVLAARSRLGGAGVLAFFFVALSSPSVLFTGSTSPAGTLFLALCSTAAAALLSYAVLERTFFLFVAGLALGAAPFFHPAALYYVIGMAATLWMLFPGDRDKHLALYIVLFSPFVLLGGGWMFLHRIYERTGPFFPELPTLAATWNPSLISFAVLACAFLVIGRQSRPENAASCSLMAAQDGTFTICDGERMARFESFWIAHLAILAAMYVLGRESDEKTPVLVLATGTMLCLAAVAAAPRGWRRSAPVLALLAVLSGVGWYELPRTWPLLNAWEQALQGESKIAALYPEDAETAAFLRSITRFREPVSLPEHGTDVLVFLAGVSRAPQDSAARIAVLPSSATREPSERFFFGNSSWRVILREAATLHDYARPDASPGVRR